MVQPLWKIIWRFLKKLKIEPPVVNRKKLHNVRVISKVYLGTK